MSNYQYALAAAYRSASDAFILALMTPQGLFATAVASTIILLILGMAIYRVGVKRGRALTWRQFEFLPRDFGSVWTGGPGASAQRARTTTPIWGQRPTTTTMQGFRQLVSTLTAPPSHLAGVRARAQWAQRASSGPLTPTYPSAPPSTPLSSTPLSSTPLRVTAPPRPVPPALYPPPPPRRPNTADAQRETPRYW